MKHVWAGWCAYVFLMLGAATDCPGLEYTFSYMWPKPEQPWYFNYTRGIAVDSKNNVYVISSLDNQVRKFSAAGSFITGWGGTGILHGLIDITIDASDSVYIVERNSCRVQVFTPNGKFLKQWGGKGSGPGQFLDPRSIAVDAPGFVYVTDWEKKQVQKFTSDGGLVSHWGDQGTGGAQLNNPTGIAVDAGGDVYVADTGSQEIKKYTSDGKLISRWPMKGASFDPDDLAYDFSQIAIDAQGMVYATKYSDNSVRKYTPDGTWLQTWDNFQIPGGGFFALPTNITIDGNGNVLVTELVQSRIQRLLPDGNIIPGWTSEGSDPGRFDDPQDIAVGPAGYVYVADARNHRVQKFTPGGTFVSQWGEQGTDGGEFLYLTGLSVDSNGFVYAVDRVLNRILKFTSDGIYVAKWGAQGQEPGEFLNPQDIAIDGDDKIYVADTGNARIQKFDIDGTFLAQWERTETGLGTLEPRCVVADTYGHVYVSGKYRSFGNTYYGPELVAKFDSNGGFVKEWDGPGSAYHFAGLSAMAVDHNDNLIIADAGLMQRFTPDGDLIPGKAMAGIGNGPGQFGRIHGLAVNSANDVYAVDGPMNRVMVLSPGEKGSSSRPKAIIVAGGGDFPGNNLWDATRLCANKAYFALRYQGYTKDTIQYLSPDTDVDVDSNGIPDDVDGNATKSNLKDALTSWAVDAADLVLYLVDHGGDTTFRIGETELVSAGDLNGWLNQHQSATGSRVTMVYDACRAGSFLAPLASPDYERVLVAGASKDESAHFASMGQLSFSYFFWGAVSNGMSLYDAYIHAHDAVTTSYPGQSPVMDANANAIGNEPNDMSAVKGWNIGKGIVFANDIPVIGSVSDAVTLNGETQAVITAGQVIDANGIDRVWASVTPPDSGVADPSQPVVALPEIEFKKTSGNTYEGVYDGFIKKGTYHVAVFASDTDGLLSVPRNTKIIQTAGPDYATLDSALNMTIPCITFQNSCYQISLSHYPDSDGGADVYWKLEVDDAYPGRACSGDCSAMDEDFRITLFKIEFQGEFYQVVLDKHFHPQEPLSHIWKLDPVSVGPL